MNNLTNIRLSEDETAVIILDQRLLPNQIKYLELNTADEMYEAIRLLKVRGAPAIGIFAAFAMYVLSKSPFNPFNPRHFVPPPSQKGALGASQKGALGALQSVGEYLKSARPTAVNLQWAVERMLKADSLSQDLRAECLAIYKEDVDMCKAISAHGLALVKDGDGILTHCNAGPLATSRYGTGLGPLILGREQGLNFKVYVDETRPLLQGARITAFELLNHGLDVTLICDNMANVVMKQGKINAVFVGCDRVAANGDVANKIGTSGLAVLAKHYGIPFYVFCPSSTIDMECKSGADIVIEERDYSEITDLYFETPIAPKGVKCFNPSFDVTPAELITAIVTEKGMWRTGKHGSPLYP